MKVSSALSTIYNHIPQGWLFREILAWPLVPIVSTVSGPVQLLRSLWACRVLAGGHWKDYNRFFLRQAVNSMFYRTQVVNIQRHGRFGVSTSLGLGRQRLSDWFYVTMPSYAAYAYAGAVVPLAGMTVWLAMHLLWLNADNMSLVLGVIAVVAFGTSFFANTFFLQNYNVLGWMCLPGVLYAWHAGEPLLAGTLILAMSFLSLTATFVAGVFSLVAVLSSGSAIPVLTMFPGVTKFAFAFLPSITGGRLIETISVVVKAIGSGSRSVRYVYAQQSGVQLWFVHGCYLYVVFIAGYYLVAGHWPVYTLAAFALFVVNSKFARFADIQSILLATLTAGGADVLAAGSPWLLIPLWILSCPAPRMINLQSYVGFLGVMPVARPFRVDGILSALEAFLDPVAPDSMIFIALKDPEGVMERMFDGQVPFLEALRYAAATKSVRVFPDYWAIYDLNYLEAPSPWGREPGEVVDQMNKWGASFALVYELDKDDLAEEWGEAGFEVVSRVRWHDLVPEDEVRRIAPEGKTPTWWLLRRSGEVGVTQI